VLLFALTEFASMKNSFPALVTRPNTIYTCMQVLYSSSTKLMVIMKRLSRIQSVFFSSVTTHTAAGKIAMFILML